MKPEHRHELKTNELAEWISNFPQWAKKNSTTIIYLSVLAIVVAGVYFWKVYEKRTISDRERLKFTGLMSQILEGKTQILHAQAQGVDISYTLIQAADDLQSIAQNVKDEQVAALALIKRAEALRMELHYRLGSIKSEDLTAQINRAKDSYTKAIEKSSTNPSLMATAKLGLGLCEEELGNFEQARQIYSEIVANTDFESTVAAAQAKERLSTMADYQQPVVFTPSPQQPPAEVIQPESEIEAPEGPQTQNGVSEVPELNLPSQP
jgi:tetratricopeptide (TPR) repeat protein